jgi:phosphonate transport system substrate-binding protein
VRRLVFGMGPVGEGPAIARLRRAFAETMGRALGVEVVTVVASSYAELGGLVERAEAQVAWLPPAVYVGAADRAGARLVAGAVRAGSRRFRGALFVRSEAPWNAVEDLRNTRVAWVDRHSCAGYLFPRLALEQRGIDIGSFFREELLFESHSAVARAVTTGQADVGATFVSESGSADLRLAGWTFEVAPAAMRELLVTEPIPSDTICTAKAVDRKRLAAIRAFFLALHERPASHDILQNLFGIDRFVECATDEYDVVRHALSAVSSSR